MMSVSFQNLYSSCLTKWLMRGDRLDMKVLKRLLTLDHSGSLSVHKHKEGHFDVTNRSDLNICHGWTKISFFIITLATQVTFHLFPVSYKTHGRFHIVCVCFYVFYLCWEDVRKGWKKYITNTVVSLDWEVHDAPAVTVAPRGKGGSHCAWCAHFLTVPCLVSH